jgi:Putative peptidoglycan binding domain/Glycosyl hydrolase family 46
MKFSKPKAGFRAPRGQIIKNVQTKLQMPAIDGVFGNDTDKAVRQWQKDNNIGVTGVVDDNSWSKLMQSPPPALMERALQLTAAFEGNGFGLANGNFDGQGLTWGIIGFTWSNNEVQQILAEAHKNYPVAFSNAFGALEPKILAVLQMDHAGQMQWAYSISVGNGERILPDWSDAFAALGAVPEIQAIQLGRVQSRYWSRAAADAAALNIQSEPGQALCFDIAVQNGGLDAGEMSAIRQQKPTSESALLKVVAEVVADHARPKYRQDVLDRKMTFATGSGTVHGDQYDVSGWGIG